MKRLLAGTVLAGAVAGLGFLVQQSLGGRAADAGPAAPVSAAPSAPATFELQVADAVMREHWDKEELEYFSLPELLAYSGQGEPLLRQDGYDDENPQLLQATLSALLAAPEPISGPPSLQALARELVHADGRAFDAAQVEAFDLVLVEYWAEWCVPCKLQMKELEAFRDSHPERRIALLEVERDPNSIEGVTLEPAPET